MVGDGHHARVVGGDHRRQPAVVGQGPDGRAHVVCRRPVELSGRLVGKEQRGPAHQRPGQRRPLLFAAGQLRRQVITSGRHPQLIEHPCRPVRAGTAVTGGCPHLSVDRQALLQVVRWALADVADETTAQPAAAASRQPHHPHAADHDRARRRSVEPGEDAQERALAAPRRAHDGRHRPAGDGEVDPTQGLDGPARRRVDLDHVGAANCALSHAAPRQDQYAR